MKNFKTYIYERGEDIYASGLYDVSTLEEAIEILDTLEDTGKAEQLGQGLYSKVFFGKQGNLVVKLSREDNISKNKEDPYFEFWIPYCRENMDNPYLPQIVWYKLFSNNTGIAVIEKLDNIGNDALTSDALRIQEWGTYEAQHEATYLRENLKRLVYGYINMFFTNPERYKNNKNPGITPGDLYVAAYTNFVSEFKKYPDEFKNLNLIIQKLADLNMYEGAHLDMHSYNFGFRKNQVIFLDPLS